MKRIMLSIALVVSVCTWASAESSVWKAQKDSSVIYLGGTCHLLRQSDFPLPPEFDKAYKASDLLIFETDLGKLQDPSTQQQLMAKAMYTDGSTIDKHLSSQVYSMLSKYCASNSIPVEALKQFKPSIVIVTLTTMELMKLGVTQEGVDLFFHKLATKDKKVVEKLETVEEQINFIVEMGKGAEDTFVTHSLSEMKNIKRDYEALVSAWETGNTKKLSELMIADLKAKTPKIYKQLIADRNENWLPIIKAYQKTPEKEFILVGVGHLVGQDGIIKALRKDGYKVEKL
jgi:uncharacterized protein YbaP (TraB family)